jgi:hypothetical protein
VVEAELQREPSPPIQDCREPEPEPEPEPAGQEASVREASELARREIEREVIVNLGMQPPASEPANQHWPDRDGERASEREREKEGGREGEGEKVWEGEREGGRGCVCVCARACVS